MTAIEAARIAQASQSNKELTPDKLANWMDRVYGLINKEAMDGKFTLNLNGFLSSRHDIERNGHLSVLIEALAEDGYEISVSATSVVVSWPLAQCVKLKSGFAALVTIDNSRPVLFFKHDNMPKEWAGAVKVFLPEQIDVIKQRYEEQQKANEGG